MRDDHDSDDELPEHLKLAASSFLALDHHTHKPISPDVTTQPGSELTRRDVLALFAVIWTKQMGSTGGTSALVGGALRAAEQGDAMNEVAFAPGTGTKQAMGDLFPFVERDTRFSYHPNTDNQLLKKEGIGDGATNIAELIRAGSRGIVGSVSPDLAGGRATSPLADLKVFSYATLAQARHFEAALRQETVKFSDFGDCFPSVRRGFDGEAVNVITGSPTGNRIAALFHGKIRRKESDRRREMSHQNIDGLNLAFDFSLDRDEDSGVYDPSTDTYSWSIRETSAARRVYRARSDTDFFVVSVLPNYIDSRSRLPPVILIEGCSALGTSGASVLWRKGSSYKPIVDLLRHRQNPRSNYWQALFRVTAVSSPQMNPLINKQERFATEVELENYREFFPVEEELERYPGKLAHQLDDLRKLLKGPPSGS